MKLFILLLLIILTSSINAQPGQIYFPPSEYYYTIIDDSGKVIEFSNNQEYGICIGDICFSPDSIPTDPKSRQVEMGNQDSLIPLGFDLKELPMTYYGKPNPNHFIRVNDFYLRILHEPSSIKITHDEDTMFLFQRSSGAAKELRFIPGYHYFPYWSNHALRGLPELLGGEFINIQQEYFIISKADYDSLRGEQYQNYNSNRQRIENEIASKFINEYAEVEYNYIPLEFIQDANPYSEGNLESPLYATDEKDVYMAMMEYRMNENNCTSYKDFFSRIDLNKNIVEHWFPRDNPQEFSSSTRFFKVDTFNHVVYLRVFYRTDTIRPIKECASWAKHENVMYKSLNGGKDWEEDEKLTDLFNEHEFYKYEFLDENYAMGYKLQKIKHKKKKYSIEQGVYYLLRDEEIVETFLTPSDIPFNRNGANYHFSKGLGDTVFLGSWGHNPYNYKESDVHHIYAVRKNSKWKFELGTNDFKRSQHYRKQEKSLEYKNFKIEGDTLLFNNGVKMVNRDRITDNPLSSGTFILERGEHIYLINTGNNYMYISFDRGATWLFNPKTLAVGGSVMLLTIDTTHKISFFNRREFAQESYKFIPNN